MLTVAVAPCASQVPEPALIFRWHSGYSYTDMLQLSPVIVVGQVRYLRFVGPIVKSVDDQGNRGDWQLQEVQTTVEVVAKGSAAGPFATFYFYTWLGGTTGDWNALHTGDRCIFFLVEDHGVLRAIRDYARSSIEVGGSRRSSLPLSETSPLEDRLAALLLMPGVGFEPRRFRRTLPRSVPIAEEWVGPCRTMRLLESIVRTTVGLVQSSARDQLLSRYQNADHCAQESR
jgi:hypothetical protein